MKNEKGNLQFVNLLFLFLTQLTANSISCKIERTMFEDEDWNINEDDLEDFNGDGILIGNNDKTRNLLTTKTPETKKDIAITLNNSELKHNVSDNLQHDIKSQHIESASQKKVLLDIFNSSFNSKEVLAIGRKHFQDQNQTEEPLECILSQPNQRRKNLILNVFQDDVGQSKPIVKSVLKICDQETKLKRKKNVAFSDDPTESQSTKKLRIERVYQIQGSVRNNMHDDQRNKNTSFESSDGTSHDTSNRKKLALIDVLQSSAHKSAKVPRVKQAVVRQFPGPAGILPDNNGENDVIDLDSLDENKNNKSNQYADICSQNTKNLFSTGAWQLMIDDLPADFELYDIATIKENASEYSKNYKKVPYLAGIVHHIDYKHNDPYIILKDLSGQVEARIHHSICKLYPDALGTSIVILAKDVGLTVTSKKFVCLIISLNNLVSMYSDDVRLVETPHLKNLLNYDTTNHNESQISVLRESESQENNEICKTPSQEIRNNLQQHPKSSLRGKSNEEKVNEIFSKDIPKSKTIRKDTNEHVKSNLEAESKPADSNIDTHEFQFDEDDAWLGIDIDEINSFKSSQFPSSTPRDSHENHSNNASFQIEKSKNVGSIGSERLAETRKVESAIEQLTTKNNYESVSEKLLAFRNPNIALKQPTILKQEGSRENIPSIGNKLFIQDNDSDDEMLSQLDVDAIAASYSTQNA